MPRTISVTLPSARSREFADRLGRLDGTLSVRLHPAVSIKPEGDVVEAEVLDRTLGPAMRLADDFGVGEDPALSLTTAAPTSVVSAGNVRAVLRDSSLSSWEEVELTLGRDSTMSLDKMLVMGLAGVIAAAGIVTGALHVVIGAMVIVPGFEPLVRVALGIVHGQRSLRGGIEDVVRGYGALLLGAVVAAIVLRLTGTSLPGGGRTYLAGGELVAFWSTTTVAGVMVTVAAAFSGALLVIARRQVLTAGVMIALALVPTFTLLGVSAVAGSWATFGGAALRWLIDVVVVVSASALVLTLKRRIDRRIPSSDAARAPGDS